MKVTIIGAGAVGATTAFSLLHSGKVHELVLIDVNTEKAYGEALDLCQATPFLANCKVYQGDYNDAEGSDIVVITSGLGRKPGQTRLELAQVNAGIMKSVAHEIVKHAPKAIYIVVANPVDVLTYILIKEGGLRKDQVLGTGCLLDTIRFRTKLSEIYHVNQSQIHGNIFGEHGDTSFPVWSKVTIAGIPLKEFHELYNKTHDVKAEYTHEEVVEYVKKSGGEIIKRKGCTVYGIATSVTHIVKAISGANPSLLPVSTYFDGEYGIKDVCNTALCYVSKKGVLGIVEQELSEEENAKLIASSDALKAVIKECM